MRHFEIVIANKRPGESGLSVHRLTLGRFGTLTVAAMLSVVALCMFTAALVLGYLIAGFLLAALLVIMVVALLRGAFR
jgi:hypothetical protein